MYLQSLANPSVLNVVILFSTLFIGAVGMMLWMMQLRKKKPYYSREIRRRKNRKSKKKKMRKNKMIRKKKAKWKEKMKKN